MALLECQKTTSTSRIRTKHHLCISSISMYETKQKTLSTDQVHNLANTHVFQLKSWRWLGRQILHLQSFSLRLHLLCLYDSNENFTFSSQEFIPKWMVNWVTYASLITAMFQTQLQDIAHCKTQVKNYNNSSYMNKQFLQPIQATKDSSVRSS